MPASQPAGPSARSLAICSHRALLASKLALALVDWLSRSLESRDAF